MYSTLDDIKKLLPAEIIIQLTDDENTGAINQARVDEAISQADAEIDSYCAGKYTVPFTTVPAVVKKISVDIAIYNLYSRKVEEIPDTRKDRYNNAIRQLKRIADGTITLGIDPAPAPSSEGEIKTSDRTFTKDKLGGY
ncbi:MAG: gp436 family protein [Nitrospirota bacterium]